jgi:hypothetical protein
MNMRIPALILSVILLSACGQDEPTERQQQKNFGGELGDSYKGMLDSARQGAREAGEQMQRTDRAVRDRDR